MGGGSQSGAVRHPSSHPPPGASSHRCPPLPAGRGVSDRSARPGAVVLLLHPPQEGPHAVLPQPRPLLHRVHVLLVPHRGASPRGFWSHPAGCCNFRGHTHPGGAFPHQERPWHRAAEPRGRPQHGDVSQPSGRERLCCERGETRRDDDCSQQGGNGEARGGGSAGKRPWELVSRVQSGETPEGGTLSDLWRLRPASGPPLCLVGPLTEPLTPPVFTDSPSLSHISNSEVFLFVVCSSFLHKFFNKSKKTEWVFVLVTPVVSLLAIFVCCVNITLIICSYYKQFPAFILCV